MTEPTAVNLGAFVSLDVAPFELMSPADDSKGTGWVLQLAGPNHPATVASSQDRAAKALARSARLEAQQLNGRKVKPDERDADEVRRENIEIVVARIVGWNPVVLPFVHPTEPVEYSPATAVKVFGDRRLGWAFSQVAQKLADDATFMPRSESA